MYHTCGKAAMESHTSRICSTFLNRTSHGLLLMVTSILYTRINKLRQKIHFCLSWFELKAMGNHDRSLAYIY